MKPPRINAANWTLFAPSLALWFIAISMLKGGYENVPGRRWQGFTFGTLLILAGALWLTFASRQVWRIAQHNRRQKSCLCPTCGYDLRATPDRCPECGSIPQNIN